jgi:hypothetical protein
MSMLEASRCPECNRAFDPVAASEEYAPRIQPLHCRWCSQRLMLIREFSAWTKQDAAARKR